MLGDFDSVATVAVRDTARALKFYENELGLKRLDSPEEMVLMFESGSSRLLVYPSQFAGTNQATAVTWAVDDVDAEVRALKGRGVMFEHYGNMPDMKLEGDVHVSGKRRAALIEDPDGNILAIVNRD
jgi:predicted enzyme related to lactoylglutathione lyase